VKPGLYRIAGGAGSGVTLLRAGAQGSIVVDANRAGTYRPLMAEIQRIRKGAARPVDALVLTTTGAAQAGNVAQFAEAGVPVIVQQRAVGRLAAGVKAVTYGTDYLLRVGDVEAEVEHVGSGRTGADSVVLFRDLNLVAVGDLVPAGVPEPDCASGGSFAGWAAAIDHVMWFDVDTFLPSRGAPVGKRELEALKAKLEALAESARSSGQADCRSPG
jgi:glyoxylase-like metal-dependent hydrolase (beta-lactamase superfamily II)